MNIKTLHGVYLQYAMYAFMLCCSNIRLLNIFAKSFHYRNKYKESCISKKLSFFSQQLYRLPELVCYTGKQACQKECFTTRGSSSTIRQRHKSEERGI